MKTILRHLVIETAALYVVSNIAEGIFFNNGVITVLISGAALTVASLFAKPVINMLLLPLNLISFGLFRWLSSAITLYLVTLVVKDFSLKYFTYNGYQSVWFDIPRIHLQGIFAYIAFAFLLSLITSFLYWLKK